MKKILLASTAIVAMATVSSEAFAAEKIKLELGGFMRHYVAFQNHDSTQTDGLSIGQKSNTEISFKGSTTLDNGLTVSATIEKEADGATGGDGTDVSSLTISSDAMGGLTLGNTASYADDVVVEAPGVGPVGLGDGGDYVLAGTATAFGGGIGADVGNQAMQVKYASPSFSGVSVGVSYAASATTAANTIGGTAAANDEATFGVSYEGEMGGASVSAAATLVENNVSGTLGSSSTSFGVNVGSAGFTVGGLYAQTDVGTAGSDTTYWEAGVSYETGPYAVSAIYGTSAVGTGVGTADAEATEWVLGGSYDLGAGVALVGNYFHVGAKDSVGGLANSSASGVVAGIEVGF